MATQAPVWMPVAILAGFCVVFPLFWMLVLRLLAAFGWDALAARYRFDGSFPDGFQGATAASLSISGTMWMGPNYNNCAVVIIRPEALYVRLWRVLSFGHPPLKIGWDRIERIEPRKLLWASARVLILKGTNRSLLLRGGIGATVEQSWRAATGRRPA